MRNGGGLAISLQVLKNTRFAKILAIGLKYLKRLVAMLALETVDSHPPNDTRTGAKLMRRFLSGFTKDESTLRIFAFLLLLLILEFAGVGAYLVTSAHADPSDFCFGYAICQ